MSENTLLKELTNSAEDKVNTDTAENATAEGPGTATSGTTAGGSTGPAKSMVNINNDATING